MAGEKPIYTKTELLRLSSELERIYLEIQKISDAHPSLMVYRDKLFSESFSAVAETFGRRLDYFRRDLIKFAELMPSRRGVRKSKNG